ncbi:MAG: radical SAM family heme chaperone HemW [Verrucomicrobia bacterium]|nr:radical SAM family heme chaperone HemW [Verrucomicrobiota bacterium]MDA1086066.1 radical SAM family heme chaperone HemW [Verrucomicrobiota bacterium]
MMTAQGLTSQPIVPIEAKSTSARGLYVHIPFCERKCSYCAFYVTTRDQDLVDRFIESVARELGSYAPLPSVETIYFGGGTPSLLTAVQLERLCDVVHARIPKEAIVEWSIESNPGTYTPDKVAVLAAAGVNRVSIGAQSFDDTMLKRLSRTHGGADIGATVEIVRSGGIENINLDLIASIPGIDASTWRSTLDRALALEPEHLSVYALSLDEGSALAKLAGLGRYALTTDDEQLGALHEARDALAAATMEPYEISNFARQGYRCRHNLSCWRGEDYIGLGPSAASRVGHARWSNVSDLRQYISQMEAQGVPERDVETLDARGHAAERLAFGIRMTEGVPVRWGDGFEDVLTQIESHGLLKRLDQSFRLTARGRDLADSVAREILGA